MDSSTIGGAATSTTSPLPTYVGTVDPVNDLIPIYDASTTSTVSTYRNQFLALSSAPAGISDVQTLTSKTLTSPTINGATLSGTLGGTYTIGGMPTFPASVAQLTSTQTLTNKTLTSPTITSPIITNATISADTITGFSTSNTGTIYGVAVTGGTFSGSALTAGTIGATALATNAVQANQLSASAITLGLVAITATPATASTSYVMVAGVTVAVTVPAGGRKLEIDMSAYQFYCGAAYYLAIYRGTSSGALTTLVQDFAIASSISVSNLVAYDTVAAGAYYYTLAYKTSNAADSIGSGAGSANSITLAVKAI